MAMQITSSNKETAEEYRALMRHEQHEPEAKANQQKTEMDKQSQLGCLNTCCYKSCSTRELSLSSMFFAHLAIKKKEKTLIFNLTAPQVSATPPHRRHPNTPPTFAVKKGETKGNGPFITGQQETVQVDNGCRIKPEIIGHL